MEPEFVEEKTFVEKIKDSFVELVEFVAIVAAVFVVVRFFIAEPHRVSGLSMVPNFHDGDYIITNKLATDFGKLDRGEVIILKNPRNIDQVFIKRIIGLPNDQIRIFNGKFYINNQPFEEPYLSKGLKTNGGYFLSEGETIEVPKDQYFVAGDNRTGSSDSREWGTVEKDLIVGQAYLRYWPPKSFKIIEVAEASNY